MTLMKWTAALGLSLSLLAPVHAVEDVFWLDVQNNKTSSVMRYLAQGVDPNIKSREALPAVMWAIQNEAWGVYYLLTSHRAFDPNATNDHDETPLMYLALLGEKQRALDLIAKGAKVNRLGWTPLHYAASKKELEMAQLLLDKGALVNAPAPDGTTPLMMAARSGSSKMTNLLLKNGADPTTRSVTKLSAADWAEANKQTRLAEQLRQVEARYQQQRVQTQGKMGAFSIDEVAEQEPAPSGTAERPAGTSTGTSQYFDLKRFDEPVNP